EGSVLPYVSDPPTTGSGSRAWNLSLRTPTGPIDSSNLANHEHVSSRPHKRENCHDQEGKRVVARQLHDVAAYDRRDDSRHCAKAILSPRPPTCRQLTGKRLGDCPMVGNNDAKSRISYVEKN